MEWHEQGLILGTRKQGETSVILEVMTHGHGRHLGIVRGGRSRKMAAMLQPGNSVEVTWRARLSEHLGMFQLEPHKLRAASLMQERAHLYTVQLLASHLRLLPERQPYPKLYKSALEILDDMPTNEALAPLIALFELSLLDELGFGLDLSCCASTGVRDELVYVSPKSGRAVCAQAGEPYKNRMLPLPQFLRGARDISDKDRADGLALSGFFLNRHIWQPRNMAAPDIRANLVTLLCGKSV